MDDYAIVQLVDEESEELLLIDSGTKAEIEKSFDAMVAEGSNNSFYMIRIVKSAEVILDVADHGDVE